MHATRTCASMSPHSLAPHLLRKSVSRRRHTHPSRSGRDDVTANPAPMPDVYNQLPTSANVTSTLMPDSATSAVLTELQQRVRSSSTLNVYGKPYTKTEITALEAAVSYLSANSHGSAAAASGPEALRRYLLEVLLLDAAIHKRIPLPVVEGAMALLELLPRTTAGAGDEGMEETGAFMDDPALLTNYRWQLVVGADVGGVQYIPAVEELQVSPDGSSFTLGTDLDFIFTGFSGPCQWLSPGHLSYKVRQVRVELRWPKAWRQATAWLAWRRRLGGAGDATAAAGDKLDWADSLPMSPGCREDSSSPATTLPLPFPTNELLAFSCDGRVAATRNRLSGGLILLLEVDTRERLRAPTTTTTKVARGFL